MEERTAPELSGYRNDGPVRIGNAAAEQVQNDTYGSVILAAMPMFYDRRLPRLGDEGLFRLLESLGGKAGELALEADNGIWEYRGRQRIHTHSTAMCWAGSSAQNRRRRRRRTGRCFARSAHWAMKRPRASGRSAHARSSRRIDGSGEEPTRL